tara:strand:- start:87 stop:3464 length:3378 start_codon:yes stop_codon:yes gene_type:complete
MRKILVFVLLLIILNTANSLSSDNDYVFSWDTWDSSNFENSYDTFEHNFEADPSSGFEADPSNSWKTIETNPDFMTNPDVLDAAFNNDAAGAANIIDQNPHLMDDPNVATRFDQEAQNNNNLLNDNPNAKKKWFAQKGITDEGAEVDSYDGEIVKTGGSEGTTFSINDYIGARVLPSGRLVLANNVEIASGIVIQEYDGSINVQGGKVYIPDTVDVHIIVEQGAIQIGDVIYTSYNKIDVLLEGDLVTISGIDVVEGDEIITAVFSGTVQTYKDGHKVFLSGTSYTTYKDGEKSKTFIVSNYIDYYTQKGGCANSQNCIQDFEDTLKVSTLDNKLDIQIYDNSIKNLFVEQITDQSIVSFSYEGDEVIFSQNPIVIGSYTGKGLMKINIKNEIIVDDVNIKQEIDNGEFYITIVGDERRHVGSITSSFKRFEESISDQLYITKKEGIITEEDEEFLNSLWDESNEALQRLREAAERLQNAGPDEIDEAEQAYDGALAEYRSINNNLFIITQGLETNDRRVYYFGVEDVTDHIASRYVPNQFINYENPSFIEEGTDPTNYDMDYILGVVRAREAKYNVMDAEWVYDNSRGEKKAKARTDFYDAQEKYQDFNTPLDLQLNLLWELQKQGPGVSVPLIMYRAFTGVEIRETIRRAYEYSHGGITEPYFMTDPEEWGKLSQDIQDRMDRALEKGRMFGVRQEFTLGKNLKLTGDVVVSIQEYTTDQEDAELGLPFHPSRFYKGPQGYSLSDLHGDDVVGSNEFVFGTTHYLNGERITRYEYELLKPSMMMRENLASREEPSRYVYSGLTPVEKGIQSVEKYYSDQNQGIFKNIDDYPYYDADLKSYAYLPGRSIDSSFSLNYELYNAQRTYQDFPMDVGEVQSFTAAGDSEVINRVVFASNTKNWHLVSYNPTWHGQQQLPGPLSIYDLGYRFHTLVDPLTGEELYYTKAKKRAQQYESLVEQEIQQREQGLKDIEGTEVFYNEIPYHVNRYGNIVPGQAPSKKGIIRFFFGWLADAIRNKNKVDITNIHYKEISERMRGKVEMLYAPIGTEVRVQKGEYYGIDPGTYYVGDDNQIHRKGVNFLFWSNEDTIGGANVRYEVLADRLNAEAFPEFDDNPLYQTNSVNQTG